MRILGLDVGERRIGVAICDPQERFAFPLTLLERRDEETALAAIAELVEREAAEAVVVGLPLSLDGSHGPQARRVAAFTQALAQRLPLPVTPWDERLTTVEAERRLREAGHSRRGLKDRRDAVAAALMLQSYLDRRRATVG